MVLPLSGPGEWWEQHGAKLVRDVTPYETAKLRMLNGAHSLLAYCGLRAGYEFVHEAVADKVLVKLAQKLMLEEAAQTLTPAKGQDLYAYSEELLARFADPALRHRLAQIAMDGTQKIPQRWLDTALSLKRCGKDFEAIRTGFDAWLWHIEDARFVDDPFGEDLKSLMNKGGRGDVIKYCFQPDDSRDGLWPGFAMLAQSL